jgi:hypothetical protein
MEEREQHERIDLRRVERLERGDDGEEHGRVGLALGHRLAHELEHGTRRAHPGEVAEQARKRTPRVRVRERRERGRARAMSAILPCAAVSSVTTRSDSP